MGLGWGLMIGWALAAEPSGCALEGGCPPPRVAIVADARGPSAVLDPSVAEIVGGQEIIALGCAGLPLGGGSLNEACDVTDLGDAVLAEVNKARARGASPEVYWLGDRLGASAADLCGGTAPVQARNGILVVGCALSARPVPPSAKPSRRGAVDLIAVAVEMSRYWLEIDDCFVDPEGKIYKHRSYEIRFDIDSDGRAGQISVINYTPMNPSRRSGCVSEIVYNMRCPAAHGDGPAPVVWSYEQSIPKRRWPLDRL